MKRFLLVVALLLVCLAQGDYASAQSKKRPGVQRPKLGTNPAANIRDRAVYNRPTTSPYLNLARPQGASGVPNYQTLVRPQVQQDRLNAQQRTAMKNLQSEIANIEGAPPPYKGVRPTGHTTTFQSHGGYFGSYP
jgi:hypothetical protein